MVDDRGRLRWNPLSNDCTKTVLLCLIISISVQFFTSYTTSWFDDNSKKSDALSKRSLSKWVPPDRIAYLEDPILEGRWKGDKELSIRIPEYSEQIKTSAAQQSEALAAIKSAERSRNHGNKKKCKAIIEHALALAPNHPDVLTEYGIYLEVMEDDVVDAEKYYTRALAYNPHHSTALERRRRTRPQVDALDMRRMSRIHEKRNEFARLPHSATLRRGMRDSYFSHIYHSVAIEGNTLSLGQTRSILESGMPVPGKSLFEHNEVLGMDSALRFINQSLINNHDIELLDILDMHRRVLGHSSPLDAGRFRTTQVYVGRFTPVGPSEVVSQMEELIEWLRDPSTAIMNPVERAAIAHYKLVLVHPFVDGNGRTARLLMNVCLMRSGYPPVILPVEERAEYYATLHTANLGDLRPFVRFVAKHTERTLQAYIDLACNSLQCSPPQSLP